MRFGWSTFPCWMKHFARRGFKPRSHGIRALNMNQSDPVSTVFPIPRESSKKQKDMCRGSHLKVLLEGQMLQNRRRKIRLKLLHLVFLRSKKITFSKKIHIISFKLKINRYIIPEYCNKYLSWNICQKRLTNYFFNHQWQCSNILLDHKFVSNINV